MTTHIKMVDGVATFCPPDESLERLYKAYRQERSWYGYTHAQIVSEGVFGSHADLFLLRYDLDVSGAVDAAIKADKLQPRTSSAPELSADGRPINADYWPRVPDRPLQP